MEKWVKRKQKCPLCNNVEGNFHNSGSLCSPKFPKGIQAPIYDDDESESEDSEPDSEFDGIMDPDTGTESC